MALALAPFSKGAAQLQRKSPSKKPVKLPKRLGPAMTLPQRLHDLLSAAARPLFACLPKL
jgi:hypothetical protein